MFDVSALKFDKDGLVPAIVQDYENGEVLMMAYMNRLAVEKTLETGLCHYWSRSRGKLWLKGDSRAPAAPARAGTAGTTRTSSRSARAAPPLARAATARRSAARSRARSFFNVSTICARTWSSVCVSAACLASTLMMFP